MDFSLFGILANPGLMVLCYVAGMAVKASKINDDFIPVICAVVGMILGPVAYFIIPEFPATDPMTAVIIGAVSGLAAVGANQIAKKTKKAIEAKKSKEESTDEQQ